MDVGRAPTNTGVKSTSAPSTPAQGAARGRAGARAAEGVRALPRVQKIRRGDTLDGRYELARRHTNTGVPCGRRLRPQAAGLRPQVSGPAAAVAPAAAAAAKTAAAAAKTAAAVHGRREKKDFGPAAAEKKDFGPAAAGCVPAAAGPRGLRPQDGRLRRRRRACGRRPGNLRPQPDFPAAAPDSPAAAGHSSICVGLQYLYGPFLPRYQ